MTINFDSVSQYQWINTHCLYHSYSFNEDIGHYLPNNAAFYRFVCFGWDIPAAQVKEWFLSASQLRPDDKFYFLCNDEFHSIELQSYGLNAHHISLNAFLDENNFSLSNGDQVKKYDAIYIARMNRFKRHYLAKDISRLLLVGTVISEGDDERYFQEVANLMPHAEMTHKNSEKQFLDVDEVANQLKEASVGLILSEREGGSYVTTEYMLAGLPVVSTASTGGRDCWLHPKFSRVVASTSESVRQAVDEFLSNPPHPEEVRNYALKVICEHRQRFFNLGQRMYEQEKVGRDFARDFYQIFHHRFAQWRTSANVMELWTEMFGMPWPE